MELILNFNQTPLLLSVESTDIFELLSSQPGVDFSIISI